MICRQELKHGFVGLNVKKTTKKKQNNNQKTKNLTQPVGVMDSQVRTVTISNKLIVIYIFKALLGYF